MALLSNALDRTKDMTLAPKLTRRASLAGLGAVLASRSAAADPAVIDVAAELTRIEASVDGRLGIHVHDTATGRRLGHRSDERFAMCSTFKVLACAAVLARVDAGQDSLSRRVQFQASDLVAYSPVTKDRAGGDGMTLAELCEAGLTQSDNTAGNLIVASLGGPSGVTAYARALGDAVTRLDRTETSLNDAVPGDPRDTTTPAAMTANLEGLVLGSALAAPSRDQSQPGSSPIGPEPRSCERAFRTTGASATRRAAAIGARRTTSR